MNARHTLCALLTACATFVPTAHALAQQDAPDRRGGLQKGDLAAVPAINRFNARAGDSLAPGNQLSFTVFGTPGAKVDVTVAGVRGAVPLPEVRPGEYSAAYTIRRDDLITPDSQVTATIRKGGHYASTVLGTPLPVAAPSPAAQVARYCTNCATVTAVNASEAIGAVGGSGAGGTGSNVRHEVVVRYSNGATQTITYDNDPGYRVGDKVKVNNGVVTRDQ